MSKRPWTQAEVLLMREHYANTPTADLAQALGRHVKSVHAKANDMGLHKSRELIAQMARERSSAADHGGCGHRWQPGHKPWNKGQPGSTGRHPRSTQHHFAPGNRPHTWVPVGSYRITSGGNGGKAVEVKVSDTPGPSNMRWRPVHQIVWEQAYGSVPDGLVVVFRPGRHTLDPAKITPDALETVTRAELMRRNSYHARMPPELRQVVQLRGVLTRTINDRIRKDKPA